MNKLLVLVATAALLFLGGCASESFKVHTPKPTTADAPTLVLLNQTRWEPVLRAELAKRNFNLVKLPSNDLVANKAGAGESERVSKESNIQYGLTFLVETKLTCPHNSAEWIAGSLEITDLRKNKVVFLIGIDEWTMPCAFRGTDGLNQLMDLFEKTWGEHIGNR